MKKPISFSNFKEAVSKDGKKLVIVRTGNPRGIEPKTEGGLWDNIHKRRKAGKAPKKPGQKGYPKTLDIESKEAYEPITTKRSQALAKADAEPKKPVTLPKAPWDKKKASVSELSIADVKKGTEKAKKRQEKERKATGKTSTSTTDLAARREGKAYGPTGVSYSDEPNLVSKPKPKKEGAMKRMSTGDGMNTFKKKPVSDKEKADAVYKASQDKKFGPGGSYEKGAAAIRKLPGMKKRNIVKEDPEMDKMIAKNNAAQRAKRDAADPAARTRAHDVAKIQAKPNTGSTSPNSIGRRNQPGIGMKKENYVSAAQRMAVHATKADDGKGHPDNKKKLKAHKVPGKTKGPHAEGKVGDFVIKKAAPKLAGAASTMGAKKKDVETLRKDVVARGKAPGASFAQKVVSKASDSKFAKKLTKKTQDNMDESVKSMAHDMAKKVAKKTRDPKTLRRLAHDLANKAADATAEGAMKRMSTGDGMDTYKKKPDEVKKKKPIKLKDRQVKLKNFRLPNNEAMVRSNSPEHKAAVKKYIGGMKSNRPGTPDSKLPRQMRDPKKDAMVSKGGKVKVIDKSKEDDHLKKGYVRAEDFISKELFMKEANMLVTRPGSNAPIKISVDQWPSFKARGYHHAEQKEMNMNRMKLIDKMKKASPAAKKALEAPSRVKSPNVTYDKNGNVIKESVECVDCECNPCECGDWRSDMGPQGGGIATEDAEKLGEALDMKQRLARGRSARKNKAKMAMGRKKAGRRIASMKVLKKRARRAARKTLTKRLTKGVAKSDLSVSRKREIEKRLDKPAFKIKANRLVKRTIKDIRKKEIARKRKQ